jgi:hypothetical protein
MDKIVKCVREAVIDINRAGQEIHTHLAFEPDLSSARQQILGQHTDKADIERALQVLCRSLDATYTICSAAVLCCATHDFQLQAVRS